MNPRRDAAELARTLEELDGRGYKAYKTVQGTWHFGVFTLHVDHVQGDPFADPSRVRVVVPPSEAGLPGGAYAGASRAVGTAAYLARRFAAAARAASRRIGTGRGGEIRMEDPGQKVLPQTAVLVGTDGGVEARFTVGLPAAGRRILGRAASELLTRTVPALVAEVLLAGAHDADEVERHAATNEDADALRAEVERRGLVAFVADGARLPRRSGVDDRPLRDEPGGTRVVPFRSPESLRVRIPTPNSGEIAGMGIPPGITLVVGGGFHGKSTLLRALEAGVYNHRPGDGRERVVSIRDAVKVRAEDGRAVTGVDISPFIGTLPQGRDTSFFSTPNASGSTSQAAAIMEALESGARALLIDEDTSATNFMIRDRRMQELVPKASEPITPFVDQARKLYAACDVSCVLVLGGSGDYLDVADTVIRMNAYLAEEVTEEAREVARRFPTGRESEAGRPVATPPPRRLPAGALNPERGRRPVHVKVPDARTLVFGQEVVDVVAVEQIVARAQLRALGLALAHVARVSKERGGLTVREALDAVDRLLEQDGLDGLDPRRPGNLFSFRRHELAAILNRLRTLRVVPG